MQKYSSLPNTSFMENQQNTIYSKGQEGASRLVNNRQIRNQQKELCRTTAAHSAGPE
jgi:hypothetical protein